MDRTFLLCARWANRVSALCLLAASAGALTRHPGFNLFGEGDEFATFLRLVGVVVALGTGVVCLTPWRGASVAPFVFLNFLFFSSIFGALAKDALFTKVLVGVFFVGWLLARIIHEKVN
jgi:hypothetical protein